MSSYSRPIFDSYDDEEPDDGSPDDGSSDGESPDDGSSDGESPDAEAGGKADADEGAADLDDEFPLGDGVADVEATVWCPYCGEPNEVAVDPGGGALQEYVEDCGVCCQPWRVTVAYGADGAAYVSAEAADA